MIETDKTAWLKMLAAMALAEAKDSRSDPHKVEPYLSKISTKDLKTAIVATNYCMIAVAIAEELGTREDMTVTELLRLTDMVAHEGTKKTLHEVAAKVQAARNEPCDMETVKKLCTFGMTYAAIKKVVELSLQSVPKGKLPDFLGQDMDRLIVNEFKRRNDPIGERILSVLNAKTAGTIRESIMDMACNDPRVQVEHVFATKSNDLTRSLLYQKLKPLPLEQKIEYYRTASMDFQATILQSIKTDEQPMTKRSIDILLYTPCSSEVRASVIRTLGKQLPMEQLLEMRAETDNKELAEAYAEVFEVRLPELKTFLAS